eukprot:COSAG02_NODE_1128_length_14425_cov_18.666271_11_plen_339_part_00
MVCGLVPVTVTALTQCHGLPGSQRSKMRRVSVITQHVGVRIHANVAATEVQSSTKALLGPGVTTATLAQLTGRATIDFGLEIRGYDLRQLAAADAEQVKRFEQLVIEYRVLIFRGQRLSEAEELQVMKCLPHDARFRPTEITLLGNVDRVGQPLPDTRLPHGKPRQAATPANPHGRPMEYWHCDGAQNAMPQLYSAISAASAVARCGGSSTKFVSGTNALDVLPDDLRQRATSLAVRNAGGGHAPGQDREGNPDTPDLGPRLRHHDDQHGYSHVTNPLVRESPHGGSLWVSPNDMERLETMDGTEVLTPDDSHRLLQEILRPGLANECACGSLLPGSR